MRKTFILFIGFLFFSLSAQPQKGPADYVNPFVGASTSTAVAKSSHGLGKTFPGVATPFGLVQLSPDTKTGGDNGPGYSWHHPTIEGFSFLHLSGIGWYGEFGNFLVTPTVGPLHTWAGNEANPGNGYRSRFSHDTEEASVGYYAVTLDDYGVHAELTAAPHTGMLRFTYPQSNTARISIDLARRIGGSATEQFVQVVDTTTIEGWMHCTPNDGGWGNGAGGVEYTVYFHCEFSRPLQNFGVWSAEIPERFKRRNLGTLVEKEYQQAIASACIERGCREAKGKHLGFFTEFPTSKGEQVLMKVGISFVSIEGARKNLYQEIPHWSFETVRNETRERWNKEFSRLEVKGSERDKTIFYTALYHTMIDPRDVSDVSGEYRGADGEIYTNHDFTYRSVFSGWDVFRSQFPLQTLINPRMVNDVINSFICLAEISKKEYLPRWEIMNSYSGCMIGNPAVSVIFDAYRKGIRDWDIEKAYRFCRNTVERTGNGTLGYTPKSISRTLEYAYSDWCVSRLADRLGKKDDARLYGLRSQNYHRIWDDSIQWFRGRLEDGRFGIWLGETKQSHYCVESNPLQQGWFVPHDVYGLIKLLGRKEFARKLTDFFDRSSEDFLWNDYYNHPNEPVHHVPFLFPYVGEPWLTQKWTRRICEVAYGTDVTGLCGNEDVGQMSAWYILASIGMHPVCPGDGIYILTSPVFDEITMQFDPEFYSGSGKLTIRAHNNSSENVYIQKILLNGKTLRRAWIKQEEVITGGTLEFFMGPKPNKEFANYPSPPSNS